MNFNNERKKKERQNLKEKKKKRGCEIEEFTLSPNKGRNKSKKEPHKERKSFH
jgi:hypothetical protein